MSVYARRDAHPGAEADAGRRAGVGWRLRRATVAWVALAGGGGMAAVNVDFCAVSKDDDGGGRLRSGGRVIVNEVERIAGHDARFGRWRMVVDGDLVVVEDLEGCACWRELDGHLAAHSRARVCRAVGGGRGGRAGAAGVAEAALGREVALGEPARIMGASRGADCNVGKRRSTRVRGSEGAAGTHPVSFLLIPRAAYAGSPSLLSPLRPPSFLHP